MTKPRQVDYVGRMWSIALVCLIIAGLDSISHTAAVAAVLVALVLWLVWIFVRMTRRP